MVGIYKTSNMAAYSFQAKMGSTFVLALLALACAMVYAQNLDEDDLGFEKRAMRNALVRFGRASGGMRNALVRFGKRSSGDFETLYENSAVQDKRNGPPQPFEETDWVRFGRSGQLDHMHDILSTLKKLESANTL